MAGLGGVPGFGTATEDYERETASDVAQADNAEDTPAKPQTPGAPRSGTKAPLAAGGGAR